MVVEIGCCYRWWGRRCGRVGREGSAVEGILVANRRLAVTEKFLLLEHCCYSVISGDLKKEGCWWKMGGWRWRWRAVAGAREKEKSYDWVKDLYEFL